MTIYSYIDYGAAGDLTSAQVDAPQTFEPITLQYVSTADIFVTRTDTEGVTVTLTPSQYTITTSPSLKVIIKEVGDGGIDVIASDIVRIGRTTPVTTVSRSFTDGSVLKASDLNTQNTQFLYTIQESLDGTNTSLPISFDDKFDAGGRVIKNLGTPSNEDESVSLGYVTELYLYGGGGAAPQAWTWTLTAGDVEGTHREFDLTASIPQPGTAVDNMYLVEVEGILQHPSVDYTVFEVGETYTLRLVNAAPGQAQAIENGVEVRIRNFGVSRNVQAGAFKAPSETGTTLALETLPYQTGPLIKADDGATTDYFTVDINGQVIIGDGGVDAQTTSSLSTTQLMIGHVDTADETKYGIQAKTTAYEVGYLTLQGSSVVENRAAEKVFKIVEGIASGEEEERFSVTLGGAIVATGDLSAAAVTASGALTVAGDSTLSGDVTIADGKKITIGSSLNLSKTDINEVERVRLNTYTEHQNVTQVELTDGVIYLEGDAVSGDDANYGFFAIGTGGPFMGRGGDGDGQPHGGPGSSRFTDTGATSRYGPYIQAKSDRISVNGYVVPTDQGGNQGASHVIANGTAGADAPAQLKYSNFMYLKPWSYLNADGIPCKGQLDVEINKQANTLHEAYIVGWHVGASSGWKDNQWRSVPIINNSWYSGASINGNSQSGMGHTLQHATSWRRTRGTYAHGGLITTDPSSGTILILDGTWELTYQFRVAVDGGTDEADWEPWLRIYERDTLTGGNGHSIEPHAFRLNRRFEDGVEATTSSTIATTIGMSPYRPADMYWSEEAKVVDATTTPWSLRFEIRRHSGGSPGSGIGPITFQGMSMFCRRLS